MMMMNKQGPIGIFDSGYGGLTVLKEITTLLPQYNYLYLGDNARSPYGTRSFSTIYQYTLQCVQWFFKQGCTLVILACNTASAKALRTIQQKYLPLLHDENKRVLGVIRPTSEIIGQYSKTNHVGILATSGTVQSNSYTIEIEKFFPQVKVYQQACPMWVPLIENNEHNSAGADYFIQKDIHNLLLQQPAIDTLLLACTHYPLLLQKIKNYVPATTTILTQGTIVAQSLQQYLAKHKAINNLCNKQGQVQFYTTDDVTDFNNHATVFFGKEVQANHVDL
jgi:glutamate racemase